MLLLDLIMYAICQAKKLHEQMAYLREISLAEVKNQFIFAYP